MTRKVRTALLMVFMLVFVSGGVFRMDTARCAENSKLTIAYIADEIGRIEPCG